MLTLKTHGEIEIMAEGGRRLAEVLQRLAAEAREGITTHYLDRLAYQLIHKSGAKPAFLHYKPAGAEKAYPYTLCTSVNNVVVHGQPSDYIIRKGDIVKLDLGLVYKKFNVDAAVTVAVGDVGKTVKHLLAATEEALRAGIAEARIGNTIGDIGAAIAAVAKSSKCTVAEGLTGHGIGRALHEDPTVWNDGEKGSGDALEEGLVIAIEPMFAARTGAVKQLKDESWATEDGSPAAHFEHTVAITKDGPRILTVLQ